MTLGLKECPLDVTSERGLVASEFAIANIALLLLLTEQGEPRAEVGGLILFSFCLLLQNHTRTTSFSMHSPSASIVISSDVGFGFCRKAFSKATRTLVSIEVRFLRRLPIVSGVVMGLFNCPGFVSVLSASSSHFCRRGFSLHIFLKLRFKASNLEMVVCEKSLPYNFPIAKPTSPWVKPSLILLCLNVLANCSSSSRSVVSSGEGSKSLDGVLRCCGVRPPELGVLGVNKLAGMWDVFGGVDC